VGRKPSKPAVAPTVLIALLRGVNVAGQRRVPMAELRELAVSVGCQHAETYIQSGNLVVTAALSPVVLEQQLEAALVDHFGFAVEVIARTAPDFAAYAAGTPFPDAQVERPKLVLLGIGKRAPAPGAVTALRERAIAGERIEIVGDALWFDFVAGSGRSKLTPAVIDRAAGITITTRNWNTVQELAAMADRQAAALTR
jgi:uncharacterized protein (DUF1697 family)